MSHAKLSPSSAERWMHCAGSVVLSEGMPEKSSAFAEEGTRAHAMAEQILLHGFESLVDPDVDTLRNVTVYVDYVRSLGGELMVEQRVYVTEEVYGTADAVVWQSDTKTLHVNDYKHGAGVAVEVEGNLQLKIYALAALLTFGYPAKTVTATIVQPRCAHADGPIRSVTFDAVDLIDFHAELEEAVKRVQSQYALRDAASSRAGSTGFKEFPLALTPTEKGCRWCLAAPKCPALRSKAQELAKVTFAPGLPYDPKQLAETLDFLPILEGWIKNTREFAYDEAEKGHSIPSWKLVEKRATRKWRDEGAAEAKIAAVLGEEAYAPAELKTPAAIEKLLPKDKRALLDELTVKESSGHTLVHESDKRPAIKVDAKSAFGGTS